MMETVKELKRLLDLNLNNNFDILKGDTSLQTINSNATKFNNMLEEHLFKESNGTCSHKNSERKVTQSEAVTPGIDGTVIKTFEDLVVSKLNDPQTLSSFANASPRNGLTRKSFLKKGEGLKRFSPKGCKTITNVQNQKSVNFRKQKSDLHNFLVNVSYQTKKSNNGHECETKPVIRKVIPTCNKQTMPVMPKTGKVVRFDEKKHILESRSEMLSGDNEVVFDDTDDTYVLAVRAKLEEIEKEETRLLELINLRNQLCQISHCNDNVQENDGNENDAIDDIREEITKLQEEQLTRISENSNAARQESSQDESPERITGPTYSLPNGDEIFFSHDNTIIFKHSNGTVQTVFANGLKEIHFPNGQIEKIQQNGIKEVIYPNGEKRVIKPDNTEEFISPDGSVTTIYSNGIEQVVYPNGDIEIKSKKFTQKKFHNGNLKTVYTNGCEETVYANGRIRFKDKFGNVIYNRIP